MRRALFVLPFFTLALAAPLTAQRDWTADARRDYRAWGRVDDMLRWAPFDCRMQLPSAARVSRAGAHARKVYFVYASDRDAYRAASAEAPPPVGFTVVKEAFAPTRVDEAHPFRGLPIPGAPSESAPAAGSPFTLPSPNVYRPIAQEGGGFTGAGPFQGLYVMRYEGPDARGTDAGWRYATVTADGVVSTAPEGCATCHRSAPRGRLFGLPG